MCQGKHGEVHNITEQPDQGDEDKAYAFSVRNSVLNDGLVVNVGGVDLIIIIYSGASGNIIGMS